MFRKLCSSSWRTARSQLASAEKNSRSFSGVGKNGQDSVRDRLFQNVNLPAEGSAASEAQTIEKIGSEQAHGSSAGSKILSFVGNSFLFSILGAGAFFGYYHYNYSVEQLEHMVEETKKEENKFLGSSIWAPAVEWYANYRGYLESEMKKYADPPSDQLLPDLPPHARHIKTLVLDLDDVLIHSDWTRGRGWKTFKRPGADEFIKDMAQYFELVVYTSQLPTYADPILDRLDPHRMIQYRLYRDSTRYTEGKHVRDLSKLNRDLRQVLMITADPDAYSLQPENAIKLKKWKSEEKEDTTLLDLLPFLEAVVRTNVPDVRSVVKSYDGQDIPKAFRERMEKVRDAQTKNSKKKKSFFLA